MSDPARVSTATPAGRKLAQERLVRRATTACISLAICLTGLFTSLASGVQATGTAAETAQRPDDDSGTQLTKALGDYEKAAASRNAPAPVKPLAPARAATAPAAHPPTVVSGGS